MTIRHRGIGRTMMWAVTSCLLLAIAARGSPPTANGRPAATAMRSSTASATTSPAPTRADWTTLPHPTNDTHGGY